MPSKTAPRPPKTAPRGAKMPPIRPQEAPKGTQEHPKGSQKGTQEHSNGNKCLEGLTNVARFPFLLGKVAAGRRLADLCWGLFSLFFCLFFALRFWLRFGCPKGPSWEPKWHPKAAQVGPKSVQDGLLSFYFAKNNNFHGNLRFPMNFDDFCLQDRCQNDPRST